MMIHQQRNQCNLDADGTLNISGKIKPILETLKKICDAHAAGNLNMWSTQWYADYGASDNILFPSASWSITYQIEPNDPEGSANSNWGAFTPVGGGYGWGGTCYGIYKNSNMKEEAWDYFKWVFLSKEGG